MPVEDHPIHPHGVRNADYHPWCYNKPRTRTSYWVRNGWLDVGTEHSSPCWVLVEDTSSVNCRQILDLPECSGCTAEKDHEYINKMRNLK